MKRGLDQARSAGIAVAAHECLRPFGTQWLIQSKRGFEPCPWAFDLAHFAPIRRHDRVLDLGCGVGPLMVAISIIEPELKAIVGVELNHGRASQARRNIELNQLPAAMVLRADIRQLPLPSAFDLVVANPPFYPMGWGRQKTDHGQLSATHELTGNLGDFMRAAQLSMRDHGHLVIIYDSSRLAYLLGELPKFGLMAKRIRLLEDDRGKSSRVLVLAGRGGTGLVVDTQKSMNLG